MTADDELLDTDEYEAITGVDAMVVIHLQQRYPGFWVDYDQEQGIALHDGDQTFKLGSSQRGWRIVVVDGDGYLVGACELDLPEDCQSPTQISGVIAAAIEAWDKPAEDADAA